MALNAKKRKTPEPEDIGGQIYYDEESQTPLGSPPKKRMRITQSQKQALIDNLQLEITDRARKLRAHYALQAQDLRGRIARRVNRIPIALRKVTMGELLERHNQPTTAKETTSIFKKPALPSKNTRLAPTISQDATSQNNAAAGTQRQPRGVKRPRQVLSNQPWSRSRTSNIPNSVDVNFSDKENAPSTSDLNHSLSNPKKRTKPNANNGSTRNASHATRQESKILSPKSSNSRTFPQSPLRVSPQKPSHSQQYISRPASPLKPGSPVKAANATANLAGMVDNARARATRSNATTARKITPQGATGTPGATATGTRTKRTTTRAATARAPPPRPATRLQNDRKVSSSTTTSNTSSGTTVVKPTRGAAAARKTTASAAAKKAATTGTTTAKKATTTKRAAPAVEQPAAGRRILRKRN
ncbi:hypothetical protein FQN54_003101 [Arachnomyces sp. PD_36]|nr:hypothetical protein FQN54_003101 [Arachnomyces sp. PD_36]